MSHYSDLLLSAEKIAKKAHATQTDKAGVDYFEHVKTVSEMGENLNEKIVGYLHDTIEDSDMSMSDLNGYEFSTVVLKAVKAITRNSNESWNSYIRRVGENPLATRVKLNDLAHNSDLSRINQPIKADFDRLEKYSRAIAWLEKKQISRPIASIDFVSDMHINHYVPFCPFDDVWKRENEEFIWHNYLIDQESEIVALAGDYSEMNRQSIWLIEAFAEVYEHVLVVFGNHDRYLVGKRMLDTYTSSSKNRISEVADHFSDIPNVHILQNQTIKINGITFAGSSLWYDIKSAEDLKFYNFRSNDSKYIFPNHEDIYKKYHKEDLDFYESLDYVDVMITHIPPVIPPIGGKINELYVTPVNQLKTRHWICGHQHLVVDFRVEDTNFHMNAVGYPSEKNILQLKNFSLE